MKYPVFQLNRNNKEEKKPWDKFNVVPNRRLHGDLKGIEYEHKVLCRIAGNGTIDDFRRLYENTALSDVYEIIALNQAMNY